MHDVEPLRRSASKMRPRHRTAARAPGLAGPSSSIGEGAGEARPTALLIAETEAAAGSSRPAAARRSGRVFAPSAPPPTVDFSGVDRRSAERLRRGRYPVEARLDLHGLTQAEAHRALAGFVAGARAAGKRCVLVITGHGRQSGGVLKAAVPRWLAEPSLRAQVLLLAPAQPPHGGRGALYVLLRRDGR